MRSNQDTTKRWVLIIGSTGEKAYYEKLTEEEREEIIVQFVNENPSDPLALQYNEFYNRRKSAISVDEIEALEKPIRQLEEWILKIRKPSTYSMFMPPVEMADSVRVELVNGAHKPSKKKKETMIKDTVDMLTATSEKKRIRECMESLDEAKTHNALPNRIILNGHGRGASACIKLAREIYLKYGDAIKIDMNISDPVPRPFRLKKSKIIIPPNVESLMITYAGNEKSKLFSPQSLKRIIYDDTKTTVTSLNLPMKHALPDTKKIQTINHAWWQAAFGGSKLNQKTSKKIEEEMDKLGKEDLSTESKGSRKNKQFIVATNPDINKNLKWAWPLQNFYHQLQKKAGINLASPKTLLDRGSATISASLEARQKELDRIYRNEKFSRFLTRASKWLAGGQVGILAEMRKLESKGEKDLYKRRHMAITHMMTGMVDEAKCNVKVQCIHAYSNSTLVKITDRESGQDMALIYRALPSENQDVIEKIKKGKPPYLARTYYKENIDLGHVALVEFCPSSLEQAKVSDKTNTDKISHAAQVGIKIADILNDLIKKNVVWTDLATKNILVRQDGSFAISDLKAFRELGKPERIGLDVTPQLMPEKLAEQSKKGELMNNKETINELYSYQLANILYQQVTGDVVWTGMEEKDIEEGKKNGVVPKFNFSHEVFSDQTPGGQGLMLIIAALAANELTYEKASELLEQKKYFKVEDVVHTLSEKDSGGRLGRIIDKFPTLSTTLSQYKVTETHLPPHPVIPSELVLPTSELNHYNSQLIHHTSELVHQTSELFHTEEHKIEKHKTSKTFEQYQGEFLEEIKKLLVKWESLFKDELTSKSTKSDVKTFLQNLENAVNQTKDKNQLSVLMKQQMVKLNKIKEIMNVKENSLKQTASDEHPHKH